MNFDQLQHEWQRDVAAKTTRVDPDVITQVRAGSRTFVRTIFWRDVREVSAAVLVALVFGRIALAAQAEGSPAWPAKLASVLPLGVTVFMLIDRWIARRRTSPRGDTLAAEIERAAAGVRHQVWLLRNVFWWYLLPLAGSVVLVAMQFALYAPTDMPAVAKWIVVGMMLIPAAGINWWVWRLNQRAVCDDLQPRLDQLEQQRDELRSLKDSSL